MDENGEPQGRACEQDLVPQNPVHAPACVAECAIAGGGGDVRNRRSDAPGEFNSPVANPTRYLPQSKR
jgi:hypothetical protein